MQRTRTTRTGRAEELELGSGTRSPALSVRAPPGAGQGPRSPWPGGHSCSVSLPPWPRSPPARRQWGRRDRPLATLLGQDETQLHPAFPQQPHIPVDEPRAYALPSTPPRMLHPAAHPPHQNPFMVDLHDQVGAAALPRETSCLVGGPGLVPRGTGVPRRVPGSPPAGCSPEAAGALLSERVNPRALPAWGLPRVVPVPRGGGSPLARLLSLLPHVIQGGGAGSEPMPG